MKFVSRHSPDEVSGIRQMKFVSRHSPDGVCFQAIARWRVKH